MPTLALPNSRGSNALQFSPRYVKRSIGKRIVQTGCRNARAASASTRRGFLKTIGAHAISLSAVPRLAAADVRPAPLVGAHYYLWFPEVFSGGRYLRARLKPAQEPSLGEYSSAAAATAELHIEWAANAGIHFFTLDYWPSAPLRNARIDQSILAARNIDRIRFCIFYELKDLGYDEVSGFTMFDGPAIERFLDDMDEIATRYFTHPSHLRVDGRPVIVLYVTRTAVGRFAEAMDQFRQRMSRLGLNPFVIGDEIFWRVAKVDGSGTTRTPQRERIALFDAITAYNVYDESEPTHVGYGAASALLTDTRILYAHYKAVAGRPVIPLAIPGYNDRGARPEADHYVVPREWSPGAGEGTFFAEWLRSVTLPSLDAQLPMLLVTSWNEWSEDTAIEPMAEAPPTDSDVSASGRAYTQGFPYSGYGTRYLEILREGLAAARR